MGKLFLNSTDVRQAYLQSEHDAERIEDLLFKRSDRIIFRVITKVANKYFEKLMNEHPDREMDIKNWFQNMLDRFKYRVRTY